MTHDEKRIKIAEACGFVRDNASDCWRKNGGLFFNEDPHHLRQLPDYFGDLNACHDMEKVMSTQQAHDYYERLELACGWEYASANPDQRAEAFGKTLNLW